MQKIRQIAQRRICLVPHALVVCLFVGIEAAQEIQRAAVRLIAFKHRIAGRKQVVERSAADIAVCGGNRLPPVLPLAEPCFCDLDQLVILVCVVFIEIVFAGSAAVLRFGSGNGTGCLCPDS